MLTLVAFRGKIILACEASLSFGGLAEWLKVAVLKTAVGFEPTGGSNPSPSAKLERCPSG